MSAPTECSAITAYADCTGDKGCLWAPTDENNPEQGGVCGCDTANSYVPITGKTGCFLCNDTTVQVTDGNCVCKDNTQTMTPENNVAKCVASDPDPPGPDPDQNDCKAGTYKDGENCVVCPDGQYSVDAATTCSACTDADLPVVNLAKSQCIAESTTGENVCGDENASVKEVTLEGQNTPNKYCGCNDGYKLDEERTACVTSGASAGVIVAIVCALLAVLAAAVTAAVVVMKNRKARAAEAREMLSVDNM